MTRAHLRRYGALDPPCHATRDTIGPTNFRLRAQTWPRTPPTRVRLACGHRAPPRSWTLLIALARLLRQAPRSPRRPDSRDRVALKASSDRAYTFRARASARRLSGVWRSPVAHLLWEQGVGGSNPLTPTSLSFAGGPGAYGPPVRFSRRMRKNSQDAQKGPDARGRRRP